MNYDTSTHHGNHTNHNNNNSTTDTTPSTPRHNAANNNSNNNTTQSQRLSSPLATPTTSYTLSYQSSPRSELDITNYGNDTLNIPISPNQMYNAVNLNLNQTFNDHINNNNNDNDDNNDPIDDTVHRFTLHDSFDMESDNILIEYIANVLQQSQTNNNNAVPIQASISVSPESIIHNNNDNDDALIQVESLATPHRTRSIISNQNLIQHNNTDSNTATQQQTGYSIQTETITSNNTEYPIMRCTITDNTYKPFDYTNHDTDTIDYRHANDGIDVQSIPWYVYIYTY